MQWTEDLAISLDIAASDFGKNGSYKLSTDGKTVDSDGLSQMLLEWLLNWGIIAAFKNDQTGEKQEMKPFYTVLFC